MYNQPYFIPGYYSRMMMPTMIRSSAGGIMNGAMRGFMNAPLLRSTGAAINTTGKGLGLFSRLGNSFSFVRGINWGGFINTASKTLGVVNQTIPLVRQVSPMVNNMKSMLKVASLFKDETDNNHSYRSNSVAYQNKTNSEFKNTNLINNASISNSEGMDNTSNNFSEFKDSYSDMSPTFFIS